ncbi:MAG: BspA family leucine-rich repeat surface protein, partial [Bacteroidales bacterium]|nr:BspA family leucine-rich repeat surface protein [Bacteroidales bacterium]
YGNYTGTESYIILPKEKPDGYQIVNQNVIGVATNGDYLTSCQNMFNNNTSSSLELDYLDTSNVTNMRSMFNGSQATTLDLRSFDTSNVTNMQGMFYGSQATTLDLSSFDTSNVTTVSGMFYNSQATTGYARTQADADRFNNSSNKPERLTFVVKPPA